MSYLSDDQLEDIVNQVTPGQLTKDELLEAIGLILENISGFETADSRTHSDMINHIRNLYYESISQTHSHPES